MSDYTDESLDKMLKRDLISIVLNFGKYKKVAEKNNSNNELVEEIRKFEITILVNFSLIGL